MAERCEPIAVRTERSGLVGMGEVFYSNLMRDRTEEEMIRKTVGSIRKEKNPIEVAWELYLRMRSLGLVGRKDDGELIRKVVGPSS